ncbi:MAG: sigma-70 family RNA polymerase sigma factor [Desulfobacteraceae bacterium]|nr:sigma-70 family RNA polymerase sigma factor [Desulfobacteraceae bacterium]
MDEKIISQLFMAERISLSDEEMKSLANHVKKAATRKYYEMPREFRITYEKDDWIQEAMIILCDLAMNYNPEKGPFDNYVKFFMSKKLTDLQRKIYSRYKESPIAGNDEKRSSFAEEPIYYEEEYIQKESFRILWDCIEKLEKKLKMLFKSHEVDGVSFKKLFPKYKKILNSESLSTFQRSYKEKVFNPVQDCVLRRYGKK